MRLNTITIEGNTSLVWDLTIGLTAFSVPFFISGPQWLTGTLVNTLLFISVIKLSKQRLLPVILLPSIGALLHGVLFGPLTPFLLYFLPFIWVGNSILMATFAYLRSKIFKGFNIIIAATLKSLFLFVIANLYFHFHIVPKIFINSMGLVQFITAIIGGLVALSILKVIGKNE